MWQRLALLAVQIFVPFIVQEIERMLSGKEGAVKKAVAQEVALRQISQAGFPITLDVKEAIDATIERTVGNFNSPVTVTVEGEEETLSVWEKTPSLSEKGSNSESKKKSKK